MTDEEREREVLEDLGRLLHIPAESVIAAIGGPWQRAEPHSDIAVGQQLIFVGRSGPSVALKFDLQELTLKVGVAVGQWAGPWPLLWDVHARHETFALNDAFDIETEIAAVDHAAKAGRRRLKVCRYCGELIAPELMHGADSCMGCSSRYVGIVY